MDGSVHSTLLCKKTGIMKSVNVFADKIVLMGLRGNGKIWWCVYELKLKCPLGTLLMLPIS